MTEFFPFDVFMALLVTMGPLKVMLVYADLTRDLDKPTRRRIAFKAILIAFIVGLVFIALGKVLLDLFHFSTQALSIAGGAILFIVGIGMAGAAAGASLVLGAGGIAVVVVVAKIIITGGLHLDPSKGGTAHAAPPFSNTLRP